MKKRKHKLIEADTVKYQILGISSHENDYRISWAINQELEFNLVRIDNLKIIQKKTGEHKEFSVFQYNPEDNPIKINLIANRCPDGFLISELKNIDFFLQIFGESNTQIINKIAGRIKSIDIVSAVFTISRDNLKKTGELPLE